jgi:hypothetical protein
MRPPLALSAVSIAADGSERIWYSGDKYAANRPQSLSFRTRIGEGFSDANLTLARRIDRDYNDLSLFNDLVLVGDDGQIAYEGRIGSTPRSTGGGHSIAVQTAGWMAHAKDRKFREVYVDREMRQWHEPPLNRRAQIAAGPYGQGKIQVAVDGSGLIWSVPNEALPASEFGEIHYDAGPDVTVARVFYKGARTGSFATIDAASIQVADADSFATADTYALTLDDTVRQQATTARRYVKIPVVTSGAVTPPIGTQQRMSMVAVYGNHTVSLRSPGSTEPDGVYASDVIRDIASRFCPKLNTAGVEDTTLVIPHVVFRERTTPFDAFLLLNGPHGYELAVWEDKTLHFRPYDLSDYDWQVRMDQPGVDLSLQGDTTEGLANYVVVEFDNVATGQRDQVSPSDDSSLEDTTVDHPANQHGLDVELTVGLTFPTTEEVAIAFGQSYLAEFNRPKNRGQITVQGHILDRAGHWVQPWMVRCGQTVSVTDHPNDVPRLITETSYEHSTRTMTISTDNGELNQLEAVVDYIRTSLTAANL